MFDAGDILLYVLSAWRQTSWSTFRRSLDELNRRRFAAGSEPVVVDATLFKLGTLRVLMALGHVEMAFTPSGIGTITIAPPTLVGLPGPGVRKAVLAGARSPALVEKLRDTEVVTEVAG